jgi:hypothetical protein
MAKLKCIRDILKALRKYQSKKILILEKIYKEMPDISIFLEVMGIDSH